MISSIATLVITSVLSSAIPDICTPINKIPYLTSHDAGTGYYNGMLNRFVKTQHGSFYDQLENGVRSFDLRPQRGIFGQVGMHHGNVPVGVSLRKAMDDAIMWSDENPNEVIILYTSHYSSFCLFNCGEDHTDLYREYGIPIVSKCSDLSTINSCNILDKSRNISGKSEGHILAIVECMNENYVPTVSCYGKNASFVPDYSSLLSVLKDSSVKSIDSDQLQMQQAHWQYSPNAYKGGFFKGSNVLMDEDYSFLNIQMSNFIDNLARDIRIDGDIYFINFFEVDHAANNGKLIKQSLDSYYDDVLSVYYDLYLEKTASLLPVSHGSFDDCMGYYEGEEGPLRSENLVQTAFCSIQSMFVHSGLIDHGTESIISNIQKSSETLSDVFVNYSDYGDIPVFLKDMFLSIVHVLDEDGASSTVAFDVEVINVFDHSKSQIFHLDSSDYRGVSPDWIVIDDESAVETAPANVVHKYIVYRSGVFSRVFMDNGAA